MGISKGRRDLNETDLEAAFREFEEETNIKKSYVNLMNIHPFEELFMGSNKIRYKHKYYMGQINKKIKLKYYLIIMKEIFNGLQQNNHF